MTRTAYVNARLLDAASKTDVNGGLITSQGKIAALGPEITAETVGSDTEIVNCDGQCLAPGLVDMRVSIGEPGNEHKETLDTAGKAAAAGGVTSLICLPDTDPVIDDVAGLEFIARRAREAKSVKVYAYASITRDIKGSELTEMGLLSQAGAVAFTDAWVAVSDALTMRRALSYARGFDLLIVQHPEEPRLAAGGVMNESEISTRLGLHGIPREAETIMLARDLRLVELTGARYHAAHLSTAEAVHMVRRAKEKGLRVTADVSPHHLALTEDDIGDYRTFFKISPPLRTAYDRQALIDGVADGAIDAIASDHRPQPVDSKRLPFAQAEFGVVGLETLLAVAMELVHSGQARMLDVLARLTTAPADIMGIPAGRLEVGRAADLCLFDPERQWSVDPISLHSKSKNTPFDGRSLKGKATRTVVDGRSIYAE